MSQDRLDLQRQAEKDHRSLSLRLRTLERELEEQETRGLETELHHKTHTEDLSQRVQALEKQLKHDRQFIEVRLDKFNWCVTLGLFAFGYYGFFLDCFFKVIKVS